MKVNGFGRLVKGFLPMVLVATLLVVSSCKKREPSDPDPTGEVTNEEINRWVVDTMRYYYYWNTSIPANNNLNFNRSPVDFFETILNRPADRFSWIQNAKELKEQSSGIIKTSGLGPAFIINEDNQVVLSPRYVHKGSPADLVGIKRGDFFLGINGEDWKVSGNSITNAQALFGNDPFTLQKADLNEQGKLVRGESISLTPVEDFQESAIHLDSILITPNGTKVAYLFYNRYLINQAQELIDAFKEFKAAGVTELIVDERYNGSGWVAAASLLSALIHQNFNINSPFIQYHINDNFRNWTESYSDQFGVNNEAVVTQNNLGLDRVFILATENSASASELLINNLKPFLGANNVIHVGGTTVGKDEFSTLFESSSPRLKEKDETDWGIQPIVGKYKNANGEGDFEQGLVPQHFVNEVNYPYAPMGSIEDRLVAKALSIIDPSMVAQLHRQMDLQQQSRTATVRELEEINKGLMKMRPLEVTPLHKRQPLKLY